MKKLVVSSEPRKAFHGPSPGFTLIEVLIALALFAIIAIVFAGGLGTATRAVTIADIRTRAESLARSQLEFVKEQDYIDYSKDLTAPERDPDFYEEMDIPADAGGYTLQTTAEPVDPDSHEPYLEKEGSPGVYVEDDGVQMITVTVSHEDKQIITLEGYRVDR